jgi:hypothetical protein
VDIRPMLLGGDRRSIAQSNRVLELVRGDPTRIPDLAVLAEDADPLVSQRAVDLLEKLARELPKQVQPHKRLFIGALADSDRWEIRLQVVRALPLFSWTPAQRRRVYDILRRDVDYPQKFVQAWALDSLAILAQKDAALMPDVQRALRKFERSKSKALAARAKHIRARLAD